MLPSVKTGLVVWYEAGVAEVRDVAAMWGDESGVGTVVVVGL